jgi:transmembrane sensor
MAEDFVWNLIAKKLSGEASDEELRGLEKLLRENPDLHYPVQTIVDLWTSDLKFDQHEAHDAFIKHVERMKQLKIDFRHQQDEEYPEEIKSNKKRAIFWPALVVVLIGTIFVGIKFSGSKAPAPQNLTRKSEKVISQISTRNGTRTNLLLPDGTKVKLNAGSSISYDSSFNKAIREVSLLGEAYFDVVKNKERPFIIHTSKINIKVLGTEFNVKSYPTDHTTEASLIRGSIEVTFRDKPNKKFILKPNQKIVVDNEQKTEDILETLRKNNPVKIHGLPANIKKLTYQYKTGTIIETSWVQDKLIFQDELFEDIARQLERWYGVTIIFKNNQL